VPLGGRRTDQLIYAADAVTLTVLWVSVQPIRNNPSGEGVYTCWNAQDETVAALQRDALVSDASQLTGR